MRRFIIVMAAWAAFLSPLSGNIYYPALNALAHDFGTSSSTMNLTLTTYMITQALAPAILGDFADMCGRRPAYLLGSILYLGANIGIASVKTFPGLLVLRCMQSAGSAGMVALASGVAADISTSGERGKYMGWILSGSMVGPAIGPLLGGILAEKLGWRSIFWFLTILAGCFLVPFTIAFPETGRNVVGNGSIPPQPWNRSLLNCLATIKRYHGLSVGDRSAARQIARDMRHGSAASRTLRVPNPLNTLRIVCQPGPAILLGFNAINFAAFYDISASLPYMFKQTYGFNELQLGLCFIPFGIGCLLAPLFTGPLLDHRFRAVARKVGMRIDKERGNNLDGFPIERARVPVAWPMSNLAGVTVICYGWTMNRNPPLAAPLVLLFVMGFAFVGNANAVSTLIVDMNPTTPSTATAANNLCRCMFSAVATALIIDMIESMGRGWCFTLIGVAMILASPLLLVLIKWGPGWRKKHSTAPVAEKLG
jgi:MFS family permease